MDREDIDWAAVRTAYEQTRATTREIAARYGISTERLHEQRRIAGWRCRRPNAQRTHRGKLINRVLRLLDEQVGRIEDKVGTSQVLDANDARLLVSRRKGDAAESVGRLSLAYIDRERDYQSASVTAVAHSGENTAMVPSGLVMDASAARTAAEGALRRMVRVSDSVETALPPSLLALDPGDLIAIEGQAEGPFAVDQIRDGLGRTLSAKGHGAATVSSIAPPPRRAALAPPQVQAEPVVMIAHLPDGEGHTEQVAGAFAQPWPGTINVRDSVTGADVVTLEDPAHMGVLAAPLEAGPSGIWSRGQPLTVSMINGHLASIAEMAVLGTGNRIALQSADGSWEKIGFASAELVATGTYRLDGLLRGLDGTRPAAALEGAPVLVLDGRTSDMEVPDALVGTVRRLHVYAGPFDGEGDSTAAPIDAGPALPLAPVRLRAAQEGASGDIALSWIRRTRIGGDGWGYGEVPLDFSPEAYRVRILDGDEQVRSVDVSGPGFAYTAAQQAEDFGAAAAALAFTVQQISPVLGPGHPATGVFQ